MQSIRKTRRAAPPRLTNRNSAGL